MSETGNGHHHDHDHDHDHEHRDDAGLANLLSLDAELFDTYLDDITGWLQGYAPTDARVIIDLGAGTGTGTLALARRFRSADVHAIDRSPLMLEHIKAVASEAGVGHRVRTIEADLDSGLPTLGPADVAWAALFVHELAEPDRLFRDIRAALNPGGVLAVIEMGSLPRFLPDEIGIGRPGLETRMHEILAQKKWNSYPDWQPHLERSGYDAVSQHTFTLAASTQAPAALPYARAHFGHMRQGVEGALGADDLNTLDELMSGDALAALLDRPTATVRGSRVVWAARSR